MGCMVSDVDLVEMAKHFPLRTDVPGDFLDVLISLLIYDFLLYSKYHITVLELEPTRMKPNMPDRFGFCLSLIQFNGICPEIY